MGGKALPTNHFQGGVSGFGMGLAQKATPFPGSKSWGWGIGWVFKKAGRIGLGEKNFLVLHFSAAFIGIHEYSYPLSLHYCVVFAHHTQKQKITKSGSQNSYFPFPVRKKRFFHFLFLEISGFWVPTPCLLTFLGTKNRKKSMQRCWPASKTFKGGATYVHLICRGWVWNVSQMKHGFHLGGCQYLWTSLWTHWIVLIPQLTSPTGARFLEHVIRRSGRCVQAGLEGKRRSLGLGAFLWRGSTGVSKTFRG